jgi:hypothetical protein
VTHVAGDVLRARAEQIARIEAAPSASGIVVAPAAAGPVTSTRTLDVELPDAETEVRPPAAPAPEVVPAVVPADKGAGRALVIVAGTVAAGVVAGILFVAARTHGDAPSGSASAAASVDLPQDPATPPVASASEQPEPSTVAPAASAPPSATAARTGPPAPQRPHLRPAGPSAPNCNPPTYVDPSGIRRVKPECL